MSDRIFGRTWAEIQAKQQGRNTRHIEMTGKTPATDADRELLAQHGSIEALEAAGLYGVADRLKGGDL